MPAIDAEDESVAFYDAVAPTYDTLFQASHRAAYDQLAWESVCARLPREPARIVEVGCGTGRWADRLVRLGHCVVGIEPSTGMARIARARVPAEGFRLIQQRLDDVALDPGEADLVLALGSLQYTPDPMRALIRMARWLRPGGWVYVLVDSLVALVLELRAAGKWEEADLRLRTRRAGWRLGTSRVSYHLLNAAHLQRGMRAAGLTDVGVRGVLTGVSILGRERLEERLRRDTRQQLEWERARGAIPSLADLGKHLLGYGRRAP